MGGIGSGAGGGESVQEIGELGPGEPYLDDAIKEDIEYYLKALRNVDEAREEAAKASDDLYDAAIALKNRRIKVWGVSETAEQIGYRPQLSKLKREHVGGEIITVFHISRKEYVRPGRSFNWPWIEGRTESDKLVGGWLGLQGGIQHWELIDD